MAHKLEFSVTVKNPDGSEFYHESHRIYPDDEMLAWFDAELDKYAKLCKAAANGKQDGANLSAELRMTVNDTEMDPIVVTGVSYRDLMRLEHAWHDLGGDLLKVGDKRAQGKK